MVMVSRLLRRKNLMYMLTALSLALSWTIQIWTRNGTISTLNLKASRGTLTGWTVRLKKLTLGGLLQQSSLPLRWLLCYVSNLLKPGV